MGGIWKKLTRNYYIYDKTLALWSKHPEVNYHPLFRMGRFRGAQPYVVDDDDDDDDDNDDDMMIMTMIMIMMINDDDNDDDVDDDHAIMMIKINDND